MKRISIIIIIISMALICGCDMSEDAVSLTNQTEKTTEPYSITEAGTAEFNNEIGYDISNTHETTDNISETSYVNSLDYIKTSSNVSKFKIDPEILYNQYKEAISSNELLEHTIALYDTVKDIDANGSLEYIIASRFGFSDMKDSLIIFSNDHDNLQIIYNSEEDSQISLFDFQHITGQFLECPINNETALNGSLYEPIYSENGEFNLSEDNTFYTSWWSNICIRNICYKIEFVGGTYHLLQISKEDWNAEIIYENEEPTDNYQIIYTYDELIS